MRSRVSVLASDLQHIFDTRLQSIVAYGNLADPPDGIHTLALVERLTFQDLAACVPLAMGWQRAGLAVPLILTREEFLRTLDVFPVEYGDIIARHEVVFGPSPFEGMDVNDADLRRACEQQAKSHLIHLREGYLESGGHPAAVSQLVAASAPAFGALLTNLARLDPHAAARAGATPELLAEVRSAGSATIADPSALLARYMSSVERLWQEVDRWR